MGKKGKEKERKNSTWEKILEFPQEEERGECIAEQSK